ncbi:hypothetical protein JAAARDRAFT_141776 [Jaapia argillacea MUCL 33604]|uniref:Uncharacterized protein n=1 Tax=Jaapia argillacea MUCL 33604 TaxID=933084 RepID=A0A067P9U8_9AGAM|nr:hypothetical protein JAAARDRAFT_141776 [Jaapia argillacea MUCL 33604]
MYQDNEITRDSDEGPGRFTVKVTLKWFKGRHIHGRIRLQFTLRPTSDREHLDMDAGCYLVAIGIRRRLFKNYTTIDELLAGSEHHLEWKDEVIHEPMFVASKPRGMGITNKPMSDDYHRDFLRRLSIKSGMGGVEVGPTIYLFRRNMATIATIALGRERTRHGMGHHGNSKTLEGNYDDGNTRSDWVGAMLNEIIRDPRHEKAKPSHSSYRLKDATAAPEISFEDLCVRAPVLKLLSRQAFDLRLCLQTGDPEWRNAVVSKSESFAL